MEPNNYREILLNTKNEALSLITNAQTSEELESLRITYLGKRGKLKCILEELKNFSPQKRKSIGILLNDVKNNLQKAISRQQDLILQQKEVNWLDVTQPGIHIEIYQPHPISRAIDEITRIFERIGFTRVRYPEVEWDWYAFESLNMPADHPARDEWETFFIQAPKHPKFGEMVLTPHTSNGQVREMERAGKPPIRMLNISKNYRRQQDITHIAMLHQFEGLVIDKGINIQHLKGTIEYFAHNYYGLETKIRLRPFHFQFTEPSFEVDFLCTLCQGRSVLEDNSPCRLCKAGWLEVAGAGMVHPNVLKSGGIDPDKYTGFAFGMGVERAFMLKPGLKLDDIRRLLTTNLETLRQF